MSLQTIQLSYFTVADGHEIATIALNRPDAANAMNERMIAEITAAAGDIQRRSSVRLAIVRANGKHFSAGADLNWMKQAAQLTYEENIRDAESLQKMFEALDQLNVPLLSVVHGSVFGGAVGLTAVADIVIASDSTRFCLSEVKLGLLPAIILPYVARRMNAGAFRRFATTARIFDAAAAKSSGLVDEVVGAPQIDQAIREEIELLLQGGPQAHSQLKQLYRSARKDAFAQSPLTAAAIAQARTGAEGQAGLQSFFSKSDAPWKKQLPPHWKLS